jgi:hypothetical protein
MCTAVWMLFIYCALSPLFKQSRIAHDDYLSVSFFCLLRGVESGCNNWPLRSRISDSDQSLAEMREQERILLWRRPLGSWEVSLAQLLYPPASTRLLLFRNISLPIVKLKRLANKINGLSLSSETGAAAAQFLAPLVLHVPNFYEAQWTNKGRFAQWLYPLESKIPLQHLCFLIQQLRAALISKLVRLNYVNGERISCTMIFVEN